MNNIDQFLSIYYELVKEKFSVKEKFYFYIINQQIKYKLVSRPT